MLFLFSAGFFVFNIFLGVLFGFTGVIVWDMFFSFILLLVLALFQLPYVLFKEGKDGVEFFEKNRGKKVMIEGMRFYVSENVEIKLREVDWYEWDVIVEGIIRIDNTKIPFSWL